MAPKVCAYKIVFVMVLLEVSGSSSFEILFCEKISFVCEKINCEMDSRPGVYEAYVLIS